MKRNHTKCPGSKTFEPAEEQVFRTSDVVLAPCSPLERGAGVCVRAHSTNHGDDRFALLLNPSYLTQILV